MDQAYFVSKNNLKILDIIEIQDYTILLDSEFGCKSTLVTARKPKATENNADFVFFKHEDGEIFHKGLTGAFSNTSGESEHTIAVGEIENIFDRKIFIDGEVLIGTTGIEDFIKHEIEREFSQSSDTVLNMSYITVVVATHTTSTAAVDTDDGIFNFKTYLGNMREYYGIFLEFTFGSGALTITVSKKAQPTFKFDSTVSDVDNYKEDYSVEALAKLTVKWNLKDTTTVTDLVYFLRNNRTITTNANDSDRADGSVDCLYLEKETIEEVVEEVYNKFKSNSYQHSVTADVRIGSNIYPISQFFVGHECSIKTISHGVKSSLITKIERKKDSPYLTVKFGNLPVTLLEKLRKEKS